MGPFPRPRRGRFNPDFAFESGCGAARCSSESDCESAGSTPSSTVEPFAIACSRKDCGSAPLANAISGFKSGFSLMELVVVVALLAIVAGMACPLLGSAREEAEKTAAKATMSAIREAILGNATMPGYLADMKYAPGFQPSQLKMRDLLNPSHLSVTNFDRVTERGWRGPYLRNVQPVANTKPARPFSSGIRGVVDDSTNRNETRRCGRSMGQSYRDSDSQRRLPPRATCVGRKERQVGHIAECLDYQQPGRRSGSLFEPIR